MPSEEPPYLRIADDLRRRVAAGEWRVGDRLPSRARLAISYGVGANVLQRAQELLIVEGVLEGRAGSGTYVRVPTERRPMVRARLRDDEGHSDGRTDGRTDGPTEGRSPLRAGLDGRAPDGTWDAHSFARTPAPARIAARLGIEPGDPTVRTCYEFLTEGRPVQTAESWEPMAVTGGTPVLLPELGPLAGRGVVERMAAIGIVVDRVVERPRPARATQEQAHLLGISAGDLVTLIERTSYDPDGRAVETADLVVPDSRWEIVYELPVRGH
ncbi:GntR family transcriptional regulator [Kitasatospora sp. NPDC088346]|uniref:GntR family transcriptional regulator n=1 Tax=Kitasatospora sp. NPDC088346 TaxID=3364073 RepID=UPI0038018702